MSPLPWHRMIRLGMGRFAISPDRFWQLSWREFVCLLPQHDAFGLYLTRAELDALMAAFPDQREEKRHSEENNPTGECNG